MAGSKSNYLSKALLDHVLGNEPFEAPTYLFVGLWTQALNDTSTGESAGEVSGGSYARYGSASAGDPPVAGTAYPNNATNWPAAGGSTVGTKSNGTSITFPTATGNWGTITHFALVDASSAGNILFHGDLTTPKTISTGDTASFAVGALVVTED
jgi:hypothetical protein